MKKYESVLKFIKYEVNEINYKKNEKFMMDKEGTSIDFKITPIISVKEKNMSVELVVDVFENSLENNKPFEMKVHLTGYFILKLTKDKKYNYKKVKRICLLNENQKPTQKDVNLLLNALRNKIKLSKMYDKNGVSIN